MTADTISDSVGANVRDLRKRRGWKPADLAERCRQLGAEAITPAVIENIEHGRRRDGVRTRDITVDELVSLALALSVAPADLMAELEEMTIPHLQALQAVVNDSNTRMQTLEETIEDMKYELERALGLAAASTPLVPQGES